MNVKASDMTVNTADLINTVYLGYTLSNDTTFSQVQEKMMQSADMVNRRCMRLLPANCFTVNLFGFCCCCCFLSRVSIL